MDSTTLKINQDAAIAQLTALGYQPSDMVYFRCFVPGDDPRKATDRGRSLQFPVNAIDWEALERNQQDGRGIYFVVNGCGHKDKDVSHCRAIFTEHDDIPKDESKVLWETLGLPLPSFQVDTGGKSIHTFWVLEEPITPEQWRALQTDLLEFTDGDRVLKNPSRVMRLAGAFHIKPGRDPIQSTIVSNSGKRYSFESLRAAVPAKDGEPKSEPKSVDAPAPHETTKKGRKARSWSELVKHVHIPIPESVPLEVCLSKKSRKLIESGVSKGERNSEGIALALDLVGTAAHLDCIGQRYNGDSRALLEDYAARCTPPLPGSEVETIWKSANSSSPGAALSPEMIEGCIKGWVWRQTKGDPQVNHRRSPVQMSPESERSEDSTFEVRTTSDDWIFSNYFGEGKSDWGVMDSSFYRYTDRGYWQGVQDQVITRSLALELRKLYTWKDKRGDRWKTYPHATNAKLKSALNFSRAGLHVEKPSANAHLRAFRNVTLDLIKREALPHSREHYLTTQIDADYLPNQDCPEIFQQFVVSSYGAEMLPLIQACTAMLLDSTAPWGKFIHLIGGSGSGKGTLLRFWQSLYGEENTRSGACFSDIAKPEGRHQNLSGVAIYALPDVGGYQQGLKPFYELVDNGSMSGRALFAPNGYQKRWNVRFLIASVSPLQIENSGDGWDRRVITIPTLGSCQNPDPYLEEKLRSPEIKAAVISWALSMDREQRDSLLLNPSQVSDRIADMEFEASLAGDPIKSFVDYCLRPLDGAIEVRSVDLHSYFLAYAQAFGYQPIGEKKFTQHLKTVLAKHYQNRRRLTQKDPGFVAGERSIKPARWINLRALPGVFRYEAGVLVCDKSVADEGGLYEFAEFVPQMDRIPDRMDRIPSEVNAQVCDPLQSTVNNGFQESGSHGSHGSHTFSRHTCASRNSAIAETKLVIPIDEHSPLCDPCDPYDPQSENDCPEADRSGSHTSEKYAIHTEHVCDPLPPLKKGDRVTTPRGVGVVNHATEIDGVPVFYVDGDTWTQPFPVDQVRAIAS